MSSISICCENIEVNLRAGPDLSDISREMAAIVDRSGIRDGTASATVIGSTGSITTIEYEPGVIEDLKRAVARLAPPGDVYAHEEAWHDGNGHSHVQAALIGPSITVPVRNGRLLLGAWQQVVVINHDNRGRKRTVAVTVIGEPA